MLIVSQDKSKITNDLNLTVKYCGIGKWEICNRYIETLGIYETEERAKAVLQEIINVSKRKGTICIAGDNKWASYRTIYEMPKE